MQFNRLPDGIYGYSIYRETLYALKGYLLMLQFLPTIVQKRADPLLHFKFGGDINLPTGLKVTELPSDDDIEMEKERFISRQPGEDVYSKMTVAIEEIYKAARNSADLIEFLHEYRDRCFLGMGIPLSIGVNESGQEVKWGSMKYEVSEDEIRIEYQMPIEEEFNRKLMPLLGGSDEDRFLFPEISEEDMRADAIWLGDLWSKDLITREFAIDQLRLTKKALVGTFFSDVQNANQQVMMKTQAQTMGQAGGKAGPGNQKAGKMPGKENWRLRDTSNGWLIESY
jgi:hypothetical protein